MVDIPSPNTAQTVFALFYAIMWGTLANVWPRWRAFDISAASKEGWMAYRRWIVSFALLNLAPIIFFVAALGRGARARRHRGAPALAPGNIVVIPTMQRNRLNGVQEVDGSSPSGPTRLLAVSP